MKTDFNPVSDLRMKLCTWSLIPFFCHFCCTGPQQGHSGHDFFDQHNQQQQQNWYPQHQQPSGDMPATSEPSNPPGGMPMFYNPAEYSKGVVNQPSFFNPYEDQQQQQGGTEQQQQLENQQQSDMNQQQQFHGDNYQNQWQQHDNQWNYQQQQPQQQDPNFNYSDGSMPQQQQNFPPYDPHHGQEQQPYFSQQSSDSVHGNNGDYGQPQNQWNQGPVGPEMEKDWNNPNMQTQGENNTEHQESQQGNAQVIENDDDSGGGGYLGMFHHDDNESDFLESEKTESPEQPNQQTIPRTSDDNEGVIPQSLVAPPLEGTDSMAQPGQVPPHRAEVPQGIFTPSDQMGGNNPEVGYPGFPGEQLHEGRTDNLQSNNFESGADLHTNVQQQQFFQPDNSSDGHHQSEITPPQMSSPRDSEAESLRANDGGSDVGPPSEHSSIAGSLPPSEPSLSSSATSRSNSLLEDGSSSNVPATGINNQEGLSAESTEGLGEQSENRTAPLDVNAAHLGDGFTGQAAVPPVMYSPGNLPGNGQNIQIQPPPVTTMDISRQNSAASNLSNMSVPSTTDTNISTTGSSLAESEQQVNMNGAAQVNSNDPLVAGGPPPSGPAPPASAPPPTETIPQMQDNIVTEPDIPLMPAATPQLNIQPVPQSNRPSERKTGEVPPPVQSQSNPQPVTQVPANPAASTPSVNSQPGTPQSPIVQSNPLLSGPAHPSAFRTVRAQHNRTPTSSSIVNPSPPLWSTEVPSLPSNILLAPAVPSSTSLTTPSLAQPVKLDKNLAASIANVTVPPPPTEVNSLLGQTPGGGSNNTAQTVPNQAVPTSNDQTINQVTQQMSGLSVGQVPQPTLLPPASTAAQQPATAPPVGGVPQVPAQSVQSLATVSQSSAIPPQQVATSSSSVPNRTNPNEPVKPVHPVPVLPGGQPVVSSAQDPNQTQHQQGPPGSQYGPNQVRVSYALFVS